MPRHCPLVGIAVSAALAALAGCHPQQPFYFHEDGDLSHYLGVATEIEYPDVQEQPLAEAEGAARPFSLENTKPREVWDLTLEDAIHYALANAKVMRHLGAQLLQPPQNVIPQSLLGVPPEAIPTVYDPALAESDPRQGPEAALSAFDAQFTTSVFWEKNNTPQNIGPGVEFFRPPIFKQDLGTFQAQLAKAAATGATWFLRHNVNYEWNNSNVGANPGFLPLRFNSAWNVNVEAEFRQPLLQGAGVQFNRIAGPGAVPGLNNGVVIARIRTDVALADFEAGVRNLVSDVENAYWELYFAYRHLDAMITGRDSALDTWRRTRTKYELGKAPSYEEAESRGAYLSFRNVMEEALTALYAAESNLRYMMGLAATDGRLIRPSDEPITARVTFDWSEILTEALARSVELRQQKWRIKQQELALIAAKNYLLPKLDAVGRYRWLGLGDDLIQSRGGTGNPLAYGSNAYQCLTDGHFQDWHLGLELSIPLGFRRELADVRNAQLNLAKARAVLQDQELELSHQLAAAVRQLEAAHVMTQTNFNRRIAAKKQVEAMEAAYDVGTVTLDRVLDALRLLAQADNDYYRSLVDYNEAVANIHFRKGSLLEYNGVYLSEGPWPGKAYFDARRRARARDAGRYLDYGYTRPKVISRGAYQQHAAEGPALLEDEPQGSAAGQPMPEPIPTPAPEPIRGPAEPPAPQPAGSPAEPGNSEPPPPEPGGSAADGLHIGPVLAGPRAGKVQFAAGRWSAVKPIRSDEPVAEPANQGPTQTKTQAAPLKWSNSQGGDTQDEALANPPAAEADRPSAGWKGVQR